MGYMTVNVILEYLSYPKMTKREDFMESRLIFPAVTICSLSRIPSNRLNLTTIYRLQKLKYILDNKSKLLQPQKERSMKCYSHPLCQWHWFNETCECATSYCRTELCTHNRVDVCDCSNAVCSYEKKNSTAGCANEFQVAAGIQRETCICKSNIEVKTSLSQDRQIDQASLDTLLLQLNDSDVEDVLKLIQTSKVDDLLDIEDSLMPTVADIFNYGIDFDNLIISCSYEGHVCDRGNFTVLYNAKYGKCYMFNYVGRRSLVDKPLDIYNYGSNSGLQLLLQIDGLEGVDLVSREIGARIVVHNPFDLPFVSEKGINIRPHDMTVAEIAKYEIHRLDYPWGNCMKNPQTLPFPYNRDTYTLLGCEKSCRSHKLKAACNCTRRQYMEARTVMEVPGQEIFCNRDNPWHKKCSERIIKRIQENDVSCGCVAPCKEIGYRTSVTSSQLNEGFFRSVKAIRTLESANGSFAHVDTNNLTDAMVGLKVYYSTFHVTVEKEVPSYSWETLVANIGGNLGFFLGLSLVTFFEVAEFLWDILMTVINSTFLRRSRIQDIKFEPKKKSLKGSCRNFFSCCSERSSDEKNRRSSF